MTRLEWTPGPISTGLDRGVLYLPFLAVPWNGLLNVTDSFESNSAETLYFDGVAYVVYLPNEDALINMEIFTYPSEFSENIPFGLSYRTEDRYIHLVYNVTAKFGSNTSTTLADGAVVDAFSIEGKASPVYISGEKPMAHLVLDTSVLNPEFVEEFENLLYGDENSTGRLPMPEELADLFDLWAIVVITDNGDGTWTATGPDEYVQVNPVNGSFTITGPTIQYIDEDKYHLTSW